MQFELLGTIKKYSGFGRKLGYPTANIEVRSNAVEGIFAGCVTLRGKVHEALIFVGTPITVGDDLKRAEAHILDFPDEDLYGERIVLKATKKLRDNEKFSTLELLKEQMNKDEKNAREYFKMEQPCLPES